MKTIKYTKMDKQKVIDKMISGGIVAFPTDTVFGLACIEQKEAINKIYEAKQRDFNKALPMMCSSKEMIKSVALVNDNAEKIIDAFMPGALTIVLNRNDNDSTIAIRMPDDDWILDLINTMNMPIMVTSANVSNEGSLLKWKDVYSSMKNRIDGIVTADARGETASTIIDLSNDDIKILREGPISLDEIMGVLK